MSVSDADWKNDHGPIDNPLGIVNALRSHYFTWKRDAQGDLSDAAIEARFTAAGPDGATVEEQITHLKAIRDNQPRLAGFFSQEVFGVFPEGSPGGANTDEYGVDHWGLNSRAILAVVVGAIQTLSTEINVLKAAA